MKISDIIQRVRQRTKTRFAAVETELVVGVKKYNQANLTYAHKHVGTITVEPMACMISVSLNRKTIQRGMSLHDQSKIEELVNAISLAIGSTFNISFTFEGEPVTENHVKDDPFSFKTTY